MVDRGFWILGLGLRVRGSRVKDQESRVKGLWFRA
jgi:hypothetical protein